MKNPLCILLALLAGFSGFPSPLLAEVERQDDGTYLLSGQFTFWPDKEILSTTGKFDTGEFSSVIFKQAVNNFEGVREMKKTMATFKVRARVGGGNNVLIVEEILERVDEPAAK